MFLDDSIKIDCYNREVVVDSTGLRQNGLLTIYSSRFEWMRLNRGDNVVTFTEDDPGQIDVGIYWDRRYWE